MSMLFVTEFAAVALGVAAEPELASQTVEVSKESTQSQAFTKDTVYVRLHALEACHVVFGRDPKADYNVHRRIEAGQTEYFSVPKGDAFKVAVVESVW
jgi:hypothetical protein